MAAKRYYLNNFNVNTAGFYAEKADYELKEYASAQELVTNAQRGVYKVGSALLVNTEDEVSPVQSEWMLHMAKGIADLTKDGKQPIIVSSGAVAFGRVKLRSGKPEKLERKQSLAGTGNIDLFKYWSDCFEQQGLACAELLISLNDLVDRTSRYNLRLAVLDMLKQGVVPILNENDSVSTYEMCFGDNDTLSARVAALLNAEYLVLLSDIDCLYTEDPKMEEGKQTNKNARPIKIVRELTDTIMAMGAGPRSSEGTGGMTTKLNAAEIATERGCHMIITNGKKLNPIEELKKEYSEQVDQKSERDDQNTEDDSIVYGGPGCRETWFYAERSPVEGDIRHVINRYQAQQERGERYIIIVKKGSKKKLENLKAITPDDVVEVEGNFKRGEIVIVLNENKQRIAIGRSVHSAQNLLKIKGMKTEDEVAGALDYTGRFSVMSPAFSYPSDVLRRKKSN